MLNILFWVVVVDKMLLISLFRLHLHSIYSLYLQGRTETTSEKKNPKW